MEYKIVSVRVSKENLYAIQCKKHIFGDWEYLMNDFGNPMYFTCESGARQWLKYCERAKEVWKFHLPKLPKEN